MTTTDSAAAAPATEAADTAPAKSRNGSRRIAGVVAPIVVLALVIGLWYLISYAFLDPGRRFLMPPPHLVITDGVLGDKAAECGRASAGPPPSL